MTFVTGAVFGVYRSFPAIGRKDGARMSVRSYSLAMEMTGGVEMEGQRGMRLSPWILCGAMLAGAGLLACGETFELLRRGLPWDIWLLILLLIG